MSLSRQSIALALTTKNKETKHHMHPKDKKRNRKTALANKTNYTLVCYASYNLWPRNGADPHKAFNHRKKQFTENKKTAIKNSLLLQCIANKLL